VKYSIIFLSLLTLLTLNSCSEYNKLLKSSDYEAKKNAAVAYYEEGDYLKSIALLDDVLEFYKLTQEGENLSYIYCLANYKLEDYYLSGYYFKRFIRRYPTSSHVEEALFLSALCSVRNSPQYSLDQTETYNALDQMQIFIDQYPNSSRIDTCNSIMDDLRGKLELKQFEYAKLYYRTERYKAAVVALEETLVKFPESYYKKEILYLLVKSNYQLAINSIQDKKMKRLENTLKSYRTFVSQFPDATEVKELDQLKKTTEAEIELMKEN
jgi:outer membrane protein assembly factor BamD